MLVKIANRDLNLPRLRQEIVEAGLPSGYGLLVAGFNRSNDVVGHYVPFTVRSEIARRDGPDGPIIDSADPGELRFRFDPDLTSPQEITLDGVLAAHDWTVLSTTQARKQEDRDAIPILVDRFKNWDSLNSSEKDSVLKQLTRLVARILDSSQDI